MQQTVNHRYRILSVIGHGGAGVVHLARELGSSKLVAIKVLRKERRGNPRAVARLQREASLAAEIGHPNICPVLESGLLADGTPYVVMPYLRRGTLAASLAKGPIPEPRAVSVVLCLLAALEATHARQVVHRDIKPSNVGWLHEDEVCLLDFGIAAVLNLELDPLTRSGISLGTLAYMAPEQALGEDFDHRVDLYACGVLLYEMLTRARPYDGVAGGVLDSLFAARPFPTLRSRAPQVSAAVERIVHQALARDPAQRFATAKAMSSALSRAAGWNTDEQAAPSKTTTRLPFEEETTRGARTWMKRLLP